MATLNSTLDAIDTPALARLWAKSSPMHPLWCHLLDVAAVAFELIPYFRPLEPLSREWAAALAGLHDIGKADPLFQRLCPALMATLPVELFEDVAQSEAPDGFRHEARSAELLETLLLRRAPAWPRRSCEVAARAIAGHHGRVDPEPPREGSGRLQRWMPLRSALAELVLTTVRVGDPPPEPAHADRLGVCLLGLTIVADWIASNEVLYGRASGDLTDVDAYFHAARDRARQAVQRLGLVARGEPDARLVPAWAEMWPHFAPRGVQPVVADLAASVGEAALVIVEAPMGEGKTEAALYLADAWAARLGLAGAYVALPTQATSNQIHQRYCDYLARQHPGARALLVHGMSWLLDDPAVVPPPTEIDAGIASPAEAAAQREAAAAWMRNLRRALLAPHAVGTIDQVLLAALGVKFGVLRLFGLGNKVLVVDEVHACDAYMRVRLEHVLAWCRALGTPVVLLSATLPRSQREDLVRAYLGRGEELHATSTASRDSAHDPYPLVTVVSSTGGATRCLTTKGLTRETVRPPIRLVLESGLLDDGIGYTVLAERVISSIRAGGCAAVIVNTVTAAQHAYEAIVSEATRRRGEAEILTLLFHARFPAWRRQELEADVTGLFGKNRLGGRPRPERAVLVATQVAEQSLDLDFDVMFTELAPVDRLLQRAGRLWRHERGTRPVVEPVLHLLAPRAGLYRFGASERVYDRLYLLRTLGELAERETIELPRDFRPLIEGVYDPAAAARGGVPSTELESAAKTQHDMEREDRDKALRHLIGRPNPTEFRYPDVPDEVVVLDAEEGERGSYLRAQTRKEDRMRAVFALTRVPEPDLVRAARAERLGRDGMRALFLTRASVPDWWLVRGKGATDFDEELVWGHVVLDLTSGECRRRRRIFYSPELGLRIERSANDPLDDL